MNSHLSVPGILLCVTWRTNTKLRSQRQSSTVGTAASPCPCSLTDTQASTDSDKPLSLRVPHVHCLVPLIAGWYEFPPFCTRDTIVRVPNCVHRGNVPP